MIDYQLGRVGLENYTEPEREREEGEVKFERGRGRGGEGVRER